MEKKKILIIIVSIVILIVASLIIFNKLNVSKDKFIKTSDEITFEELNNEIEKNISRAESLYKNNNYQICGYVTKIEKDNLHICDGGNVELIAYLSKEDIDSVIQGQKIKIVGKVKDINTSTQKESFGYGSYETKINYITMQKSYIIETEFEVSGIIQIPEQEYWVKELSGHVNRKKLPDNEWYCHIDKYDITEFAKNKRFSNNENLKAEISGIKVENGDSAIAKGKIIKKYYNDKGEGDINYKIEDLVSIKLINK